jgi:hypothetical protein
MRERGAALRSLYFQCAVIASAEAAVFQCVTTITLRVPHTFCNEAVAGRHRGSVGRDDRGAFPDRCGESRGRCCSMPRNAARRRLQPASVVLLFRRSLRTVSHHLCGYTAKAYFGRSRRLVGPWNTDRPDRMYIVSSYLYASVDTGGFPPRHHRYADTNTTRSSVMY